MTSLLDELKQRVASSETFRVMSPRLVWLVRRLPAWGLVVVESPYAADPAISLEYVRDAMAHCIARGEAPFASHALYTQPGVLDDTVPDERARGSAAGFAWRHVATATIVYTDLGVSSGMQQGIEHARSIGCPVIYRSLPEWKEPRSPQEDA